MAKIILPVFSTICFSFLSAEMKMESNSFSTSSMSHSHSAQPGGFIDYLIVIIGVLIVAFVFILMIKYMFFPGEKDPSHIKRIILEKRNNIYD